MVAAKSSKLIEYGLTAIALTASLVTIYSLRTSDANFAASQPPILMQRLVR